MSVPKMIVEITRQYGGTFQETIVQGICRKKIQQRVSV